MKFFYALIFVLFAGAADRAQADDNTPPPKPEQKGPEVRRIVLSRKNEGQPEEKTPENKNADPLIQKADAEREESRKSQATTKDIESALSFNMGLEDWVKRNNDILPKDIGDIVRVANKETYDSAQAKASAIKASLIQAFFSVQANIEGLTRSQRETLDDYLKLTNTGKQQKATSVYENILEPALETHRKVRKAEELSRARSGFAQGSDGQNAYRDKLLKGSRKTYLGEKEA